MHVCRCECAVSHCKMHISPWITIKKIWKVLSGPNRIHSFSSTFCVFCSISTLFLTWLTSSSIVSTSLYPNHLHPSKSYSFFQAVLAGFSQNQPPRWGCLFGKWPQKTTSKEMQKWNRKGARTTQDALRSRFLLRVTGESGGKGAGRVVHPLLPVTGARSWQVGVVRTAWGWGSHRDIGVLLA